MKRFIASANRTSTSKKCATKPLLSWVVWVATCTYGCLKLSISLYNA